MELPDGLILTGRRVTLEHSREEHAAGLASVCTATTFPHYMAGCPTSLDEGGLALYIRHRLQQEGVYPFTVLFEGSPVGMSCYLDIQPHHKALEIGMTWYGEAFRGTVVNPEAKLLLLTHAFESLICERVQLKTDARNLRSQRGIEKLGAQKEGVLRKHMTMPDGHQRDTVMYSIIRAEWPEVKQRLLVRLAAS